MNIGIAGAGKIVRECLNVAHVNEQINCPAIWGRTCEKAELLAQEYQIAKVCQSYEDLLSEPDLDAIYIGLSNDVHFDFARQALEADKNVILEKPFTSNTQQAENLAALAQEKGLLLFEAISSVHTQTFPFVRSYLQKVGDVKLVLCNYSQYSSRYDDYLQGKVHPVFDPTREGGTLVDLNVYNIHIVVSLFGAPLSVEYLPNFGWNGVDTSGTLLMRYSSFTAVCFAAKDSASPSFINIQGHLGLIRIEGFANICGEVHFMDHSGTTQNCHSDWHRMQGEFLEFERIWRENDRTTHDKLLKNTLSVMRILETARQQMQAVAKLKAA